MPCNTRITQTVELNVKTDAKVLAKALADTFGQIETYAEGKRFRFSAQGATVVLADGVLQSNSLSAASLGAVADQVKQSYAVAAMQAASKRFGWAMQETSQKQTVTRRA